MRANRLREAWASGRAVTNIWVSLGGILPTEILAHQGWDSLTIDMQHGKADFTGVVQMLTAISTTAAVPLVRVPWNNPGDINPDHIVTPGVYVQRLIHMPHAKKHIEQRTVRKRPAAAGTGQET